MNAMMVDISKMLQEQQEKLDCRFFSLLMLFQLFSNDNIGMENETNSIESSSGLAQISSFWGGVKAAIQRKLGSWFSTPINNQAEVDSPETNWTSHQQPTSTIAVHTLLVSSKMRQLIDLQHFDGSFSWQPLCSLLDEFGESVLCSTPICIGNPTDHNEESTLKLWATAIAVVYFHLRY